MELLYQNFNPSTHTTFGIQGVNVQCVACEHKGLNGLTIFGSQGVNVACEHKGLIVNVALSLIHVYMLWYM